MTAIGWNQKTIEEFHAKKGLGVGPWKDNVLLLTAGALILLGTLYPLILDALNLGRAVPVVDDSLHSAFIPHELLIPSSRART